MNAADLAGLLPVRFAAVRAATEALAAPLSDEDCCVQSMPDASPVKWHLAHTTWFFETFVLEAFEPGFAAHDAAFRMLFNSYYEAVGERHPRPRRGLLTRPSMRAVRDYRVAVDARLRALLERGLPARALELIELGLQHEQQHQELIVTDLKHLLSCNPLAPAYRPVASATQRAVARDRAGAPGDAGAADRAGAAHGAAASHPSFSRSDAAPRWVEFAESVAHIGTPAEAAFAFDNERPVHRQFVEPYALADRLATNAEYAAFVDDGGYRQPRWWLSEGWDFVQREALSQPAYWRSIDGRRFEFTLDGLVPLEAAAPVSHLSYFEAEAFARWSGARLPTEFEWEHAVRGLPVQGNFVESGRLHPQAVGAVAAAAGGQVAEPALAGLRQAFGDLWEWTASSYAPYPGFAAAPGAVGEYNGKFMVNQYVLRGGSCATPREHVRAGYRNFFPTYARWQFSGVRLARSL